MQYQVTHEMMADPVLSLSWGLPNASESRATRTGMTRVISPQPQCPTRVVGGQAGRLSGKVHNLTVCQSMKSPLIRTIATWVVALPHLSPLWVLPFLSRGAARYKSHSEHPLSSQGLAILRPHCFLPCSNGGKDKGVKGCRKILAR